MTPRASRPIARVADVERRDRYQQVFSQTFEAVQRYVHRRASAADVDDVVADTMLVLWRRLDDVPADQVVPWAYGVARRCLANHRRSADRRGRLYERLVREPPSVETVEAAAPVAPADDRDDALHAALVELDPRDRDVLHLWAWEGLAPREIAVALDITANAASIRLHRAKARLASALAGKEPTTGGHSISRHADHEEVEQQ
jgi:RNA polymerase sigma-70 factor (ECF subfamily)